MKMLLVPKNLRYVFLGEDETFPVVISYSFKSNQKAELVAILKTHRDAIGWNVADIKRVSTP